MKFEDENFKEEFMKWLNSKTEEEILQKLKELEEDKKMSADEMFDELGYEKIHDNKRRRVYSNHLARIVFKIKNKWIDINMNLDILELQAINKKCKELGWIE